ncbi:B-cell receptor CD22-like [Chanos chanos]|uniref:B-cell receptor CD22 n=1 Tax=Chanos chanos TaxID=29144 RepID=A0A6J2VZ41_CHACN|nr:B-cell receptor CD22-like [Chanos chanos]
MLRHDVTGQIWSVWYNPKGICALKGSSVTISCSYKYPTRHKVETVFWIKNRARNVEPMDLSEDPDYKGRVEYLGNKQDNCSMKLTDVTKQDARKYFFRFVTNYDTGKWIGEPGVTLSVTDLQVETPERVKEGDTVTLKCRTTCSLSNTPTFIWYKNGHVLTRKTIKNNELSLHSVSSEDRGSYMCAVQGHENLPSPAVNLTVTYPPKKTTVSVSPSGEIVEGSSVTLTCSSDANPPATYTWFKKNGTVTIGKEETYRINKISSEHSGEYQCKSNNQHGHQYSNTVSLNVLYPPRNTKVSVSPSGEIVEGSSVTLTCSSDANPPATYTWFKKNETVTLGKEKTYRINKISSEDSGQYKCKCSNQHGHQYSNTVSLNVLYGPKKIMVSVSPSGEIVEGSSVTLTCSSDANPPATYTWFKKNGTVTIGREETYRINKISSEDSGEYHCKSNNQHGHQYSNSVSLNVLYSPRNTTVSLSPSGEIVEGSSVNLTCSSDANPPQINYTWYKESVTSPVGYGQSYIINNIQSSNSGLYYCEAQNKHGSQKTTAVPITLKDTQTVLLTSGQPAATPEPVSSLSTTSTLPENFISSFSNTGLVVVFYKRKKRLMKLTGDSTLPKTPTDREGEHFYEEIREQHEESTTNPIISPVYSTPQTTPDSIIYSTVTTPPHTVTTPSTGDNRLVTAQITPDSTIYSTVTTPPHTVTTPSTGDNRLVTAERTPDSIIYSTVIKPPHTLTTPSTGDNRLVTTVYSTLQLF